MSERNAQLWRITSGLLGLGVSCAIILRIASQTPVPQSTVVGSGISFVQVFIPGAPIWAIVAGFASAITIEILTWRLQEARSYARLLSIILPQVAATVLLTLLTFSGNQVFTPVDYGFHLIVNGIAYFAPATITGILTMGIIEAVKPQAAHRKLADVWPDGLHIDK